MMMPSPPLSSLSCHIILMVVVVVVVVVVPVLSSPCDFPAIFNFGDSNSDTGGMSASLGPLPRPYGRTTFGMPTGRYSDGRLIIDFIAESLKLPHLSAYLDSVGTNFSHGANFATSASTIIPQNKTLPQAGGFSPFSLDVQLRQFLQFKSRSLAISRKAGGVFKDLLPKRDYFSRALYTLDIGHNDLTAGYFSNKSADEFMPEAMTRFSAAVKTIYQMGGRSFWIHNTGPLGCLPYVLVREPTLLPTQFDSLGCGIPYNELAQEFNKKLNDTVLQLRRDLPLAAITYVDVYSVKYSLFSQAKKLGFEHPLEACCGHGGGEYNFVNGVWCGDMGEVNGTRVRIARSCRNPLKRIDWDGVHYTETANKWVFDRVYGGEFSNPPVAVSMACQQHAA